MVTLQAQSHCEKTAATQGNTETHSKAVGHDPYTLLGHVV